MQKLIFLFLFTCGFADSFGQVTSPLVINEILFNPPKDGSDYVELYNRTDTILDLKDYLIGNRNAMGEIASLKQIAKEPFLLQPGEYVALTANEKWLRQQYFLSPLSRVIQLSSMPSYPDDEGVVVLLQRVDSSLVDEVRYHENWHFSLIEDAAGISLERIGTEVSGQKKDNWTSAASSAGFGTPGSANSQSAPARSYSSGYEVSPNVIYPDNDGYFDHLFIYFRMSAAGFIANAAIYSMEGKQVKYLLKNVVLGLQDRFSWDGCDDDGNKLPAGAYVLITQVFNVSGRLQKFKKVVVIGRRKL